jgi:PKD repeat protein
MRSKPATIFVFAAFVVLLTGIYAFPPARSGYPPQASFIYFPLKPYQNQTVSLDASASSAEGFNDTITKYEWSFGDGTPKLTKTNPYATHNFTQLSTFTITLNVTDKEGLWSTTTKKLTTLAEFPPTANFTWTPKEPFLNQITTFNASNSTLGWAARTQRFSPIQTYRWSFGDGNITSVTNPIITHKYSIPNNYTVSLTVTDADGRTNTKSAIVRVQNFTPKIYDVNGDGKIDLKDVFRVGKAYGSRPGDPKWDSPCDFNHDGIIDLKDYYPVCQHYGEDP